MGDRHTIQTTKEPGRLTAIRIRREKTRQEQAYLNAQSFLRKKSRRKAASAYGTFDNDSAESEIEELSNYEKEAEKFLEKAMNDDEYVDADHVVTLSGMDEKDLESETDNVPKIADSRDEDDASSIEHTKAELEKYAIVYGDFLSKELEDDNSESERLAEVPSKDNISFSNLTETSETIRNDSNLARKEENNLRSTYRNSEIGRRTRTEPFVPVDLEKTNAGVIAHLQDVKKILLENNHLPTSLLLRELFDAYEVMRFLIGETEETVDFLQRELRSARKLIRFYEEQKNAMPSDENTNNNTTKDFQLELELSKMEAEEAREQSIATENKLVAAKKELVLKEQRLAAQEDTYAVDHFKLTKEVAKLKRQLETENAASRGLRSQLSFAFDRIEMLEHELDLLERP